jgi:hypothetical protein
MRQSYLTGFSINAASDVNYDVTESKLVYKQTYHRYYVMIAAMINVMMDFYIFQKALELYKIIFSWKQCS